MMMMPYWKWHDNVSGIESPTGNYEPCSDTGGTDESESYMSYTNRSAHGDDSTEQSYIDSY